MKMSAIYLGALIFGIVGLEVTGRAVNISGAWFLPQEGFPVFYRYFTDKVTWNEAEAVCGFHHGDLLSVQTNTQMDAARAYLKQIDVTDNIWIGLKMDSPEKPFSWTNGEKLLGDGYWLEPIPKTNEKLCAAIDPVSDFRWNSFYCRGPQVASFVCELPVPEWAKKEDGCLITSLPSVVVTLIPEMGVIQLFSDCGLEGTRRIACKGGVSQEDLTRRLSCDEDAFATTAFSKSTTDLNTVGSTWMNPNLEVNRDETTITFKSHETYSPQTRHRRDVNSNTLEAGMSPPNENTNSVLEIADSVSEASTQTIATQAKTEMSNVLSHSPSHVPLSESDAKIQAETPESTTKPENLELIDDEKAGSENGTQAKLVTEALTNMDTRPSSTLSVLKNVINEETTTVKLEKSLKIPVYIRDPSSRDKNDVPGGSDDGVPVLIITGESFNESGNSDAPTSENPRIVLMIDDKEDFPEPYLVPIGDDIVLNNPSLSPMEVIDVDLVEIDNFTARTTISGETNSKHQTTDLPSSDTPTTPEIGRTTDELARNESSTVLLDLTSTAATPPKSTSAPVTPKTTESPKSSTQPEPFLGSDDEEDLEMPQRPNRGRRLSQHPNHSSFYPYFLNRVWG